jgi:fatty acid synthase subunit beta
MHAATRLPSSLIMPTLHLGDTQPILAVWGGLGFTRRPLKELRDLLALHHDDLAPFLRHCSSILKSLPQPMTSEDGAKVSDVQADLFGCVKDPARRMPPASSLSAEVNSAITTILQLARYVLLCQRSGKSPGDVARSCTAFAGHSLGMMVAFAMAAADSWASLYDLTEFSIRSVYWSCASAAQVWDSKMQVPDAIVTESIRTGQGTPSPMLSITGLERAIVNGEIDDLNKSTPTGRRLYLSLINESSSFVVSGGPERLVVLAGRLRARSCQVVCSSERIQAKQPSSEMGCSMQFLTNDAPYHCPHMQPALERIQEKLKRYKMHRSQLLVPVLGLESIFEDNELESLDENIIPLMTKLIMSTSVDWVRTMEMTSGRWQILDFGPGGINGIGGLINRMKAGTSSSIYTVGPTDGFATDAPLLSDAGDDSGSLVYEHIELEDRCLPSPPKAFALTSKMKDLMKLPRILIAGMTPTTCDVELVAEITNAGYYVEFASGGYNHATSLAAALRDLAMKISAGRFINVNIIYANPRALTWQIPLLVSLVREGCPIGGLTIGAGVPDTLIAGEYIRSLELSHIAFKPSTLAAIHNVLEIAKLHPTLPVLLQWTGGRSGGHHSMEDFHEILLQSYQAIRAVDNVILIAGSGFGDVEGSWPYITGEWSQAFGRSAMPCDGILFGTAIMSVLEAKTSHQAKEAIVSASGVADTDWKGTLTEPTGGVISVISHLGEHMHVVATRGMQLWADLDKSLFLKSKKDMVTKLHSDRIYYINRLNDDFQKVWFPFDSTTGQALEDLEDMTYLDVLRRLSDLLHPSTKAGWTYPTYEQVFDEFMTRALQRADSEIQILLSDEQSLHARLESIVSAVPELGVDLLALEDAHFLVEICRRPGRKPVPFILAFDDQFSVDFKKDPLWQAEALDSTYHKDVGRVCILAGPVAIKHCKEVNVPVRQFLGNINNGYVARQNVLEKDAEVSYLQSQLYGEATRAKDITAFHIYVDEDHLTLPIETTETLPNERWLLLVGAKMCTLGELFFATKRMVSLGRATSNPLRNLFAARPGATVDFSSPVEGQGASVARYRCGTADARLVIKGHDIALEIRSDCTKDRQPATLSIRFEYDELLSSITPVYDGSLTRLHDFYTECLFGQNSAEMLRSKPMDKGNATVSQDEVDSWLRAVAHGNSTSNDRHSLSDVVPIEYATVMGSMSWGQVFKLPWDVSKLLHMHTAVRVREGQVPLQISDRVVMHIEKTSVRQRDSGVEAHFHMTFHRESELTLDLDYSFVVLDQQVPPSECFEKEQESQWNAVLQTDVDKQALLSKSWIRPTCSLELPTGRNLQWNLRREVCYLAGGLTERITGEIVGQSTRENRPATILAHIKYAAPATASAKNPVFKYLERIGATCDSQVVQLPVEKLLLDQNGKPFRFKVPDNSIQYAEASGDYNPIHTTPSFARHAGYDQPIYHGNHTTALVLAAIRREVPAASNDGIRAYTTENRAVVYPGDVLATTVKHVAMDSGQAILKYEARNEDSGDTVLTGTVTLSRRSSAFYFTGQGSQHPGMGLDLAAESKVCRAVWEDADRYLEQNWGKPSFTDRMEINAMLTMWCRLFNQYSGQEESQEIDCSLRRKPRKEDPR